MPGATLSCRSLSSVPFGHKRKKACTEPQTPGLGTGPRQPVSIKPKMLDGWSFEFKSWHSSVILHMLISADSVSP